MNTIGNPGSGMVAAGEQRGPIAQVFDEGMRHKENRKRKINRISDLIKPTLRWREENEIEGDDSVQLKQAVGVYGLAATRGALQEAKWPAGENPIVFDLDINEIERQKYGEDAVTKAEKWLDNARHRLWQTMLSAKSNMRAFAAGRGFRAAMSLQDDYALTHGDSCVRIRSDYLVEVYQPQQWIAVRDGQGMLLRIVTVCKKDPKTMHPGHVEAAKLPEGWMQKPMLERMLRVYTDYSWEDGKWVLTDECNGQNIHTETHEEAHIFSCPWDLIPGNHYGDSFFEGARAKIKNLDHLCGTATDLTNLIGDVKIGIRTGSSIRPSRMVGPTGTIVPNANIVGGKWDDVGVLEINKHQALFEIRTEKRTSEDELAKLLGIDLELLPNKDRTTRLHVQEVVSRLNATKSGSVGPYLETSTSQPIRAYVDIARTNGLFGDPPDDIKDIINNFWRVSFTAGSEALARAGNVNKILAFGQAVQFVGGLDLGDKIDKEDLIAGMARDMGVKLRIRSDAEVKARQQAAQNAAIQQQAALEGAKATAPLAAAQAFGVPAQGA